jgi:acyl phosphate:glycerol-3-phosphate acyltransferase
MNSILLFIGAYLLGSIPTAVWVGKRFYNIDVREHGSGNAGATNVFRVLGKKAGIPVLLIDVIKGFLAVSLARFSQYTFGSTQFINLQLILGVFSLVGHIFPVFASFKGGKGIATLLGIIIAVYPYAAFISILIFLVIFLISGYVSLGSMTAAVAFPIIVVYVLKISIPSLVIFSVLIAIMVLITHKKNIGRLIRNEEPKTRLINKKKAQD